MEYYEAMDNTVMSLTGKWMKPEIIAKQSQSEAEWQILHILSYVATEIFKWLPEVPMLL